MVKKRLISLLACFALALAVPFAAFADIGPKPEVTVQTTGLSGDCWVTLLAEETVIGPWHETEKGTVAAVEPEEAPVLDAFDAFEDPDGYHFLQWFDRVQDASPATWSYMAPKHFKILFWFPESGSYAVTEKLDRYAYSAVYRVDFSGFDPAAGEVQTVAAQKNYDYAGEALGLAARFVLTLAVELLIALPFGYLKRQHLRVLLIANLATQLALNLALNLTTYYSGWLAMWLLYPLLELAVFIVEAVVFRLAFKPEGGKGHPVLYAFVANAASYAFGLWLGNLVPELF